MKIPQKLAIGFIRIKLNVLALLSKKKAAATAFRIFSTPFAKPIKTIPAIFKSAETVHFDLNGLKITGYRWNASHKNKILILHGFSSAAYKFSSYIEAFTHKGYEVLAFDAPAHGNSEGKTVNAAGYGSMVKKAIELYGPFDGFIAHSFGALALSLALEEMTPANDAKIVFIAPATETTTAIDTALAMLGLKNATVRNEIDTIVFNLSGKETSWFSMRRIVHSIHARILWIHDADDDITPLSDALKIKEDKHPNIEFFITNGLGHRKIYHDADVKKRIIDFIDR
jgi:pimeloyl-ACP methyl ester carboxylesterase